MGAVDGVDELFDKEFARLVRALALVFGAEAAADAVQEAFIVADRRWRVVSRYDDPAGWVRRVALNRLRNGRRDRRRREEILAGVRPVDADDLTDSLLDLRRALDSLPERMRLCVCLHHVGGYPVADTAALLGVAEGTVKSNLHDARLRLRERLEERHA